MLKSQGFKLMASIMDLEYISDRYRLIILICITILALVGLYKINILVGFLANMNINVPIEAVFAIFISAILLYALMVLIEKFNKNNNRLS